MDIDGSVCRVRMRLGAASWWRPAFSSLMLPHFEILHHALQHGSGFLKYVRHAFEKRNTHNAKEAHLQSKSSRQWHAARQTVSDLWEPMPSGCIASDPFALVVYKTSSSLGDITRLAAVQCAHGVRFALHCLSDLRACDATLVLPVHEGTDSHPKLLLSVSLYIAGT